MADVAFIGLGVMGYPMAAHLARAGHRVSVYNRSADKARRWVGEHGGKACATPREAATGAGFVLSCVGDDSDVEAVAAGDDGLLAGLAAGAVWVDHTTASANLARDMARRAGAQGAAFLDAPVSGGQAGAENGQLTVMVGGDERAYALAEPLLRCFARAVTRIGDAGAGQLAKAVNQICIAGLLQGLSEGMHFAERAGLDVETVMNVISAGAAGSWQLENRHRTMAAGEFSFGFAVEWMRKDLRICLQEARDNGASLPVTALVDQFYADVVAMGGARWDTSSLVARLRRNPG